MDVSVYRAPYIISSRMVKTFQGVRQPKSARTGEGQLVTAAGGGQRVGDDRQPDPQLGETASRKEGLERGHVAERF